MEINAYAKINLSLDIVGKKPDGYHLLDMVMQTVSLHDTLQVEKRDSGGITLRCDRGDTPCGPENTVIRAANVFVKETGLKDISVLIDLHKEIPSQAGLGGGSADAAALLRALNELYQVRMPAAELCRIALSVGADVPFCVCGGSMRAQGIGEVLSPVSPLPDCFIVICKPPFGVSTAQAYARADEDGRAAFPGTPKVIDALSTGRVDKVGAVLSNSFEALLELPEIDTIKKEMAAQGACGACMTGSGSAVFGLFETKSDAEKCASLLKTHGQEVFLSRPVQSY